jgi:cytidyltransferase-like protein
MIFYQPEDFVKYVLASEQNIIGVTSGCYDLLHPLHVEYLNKCARQCRELYVFLDSDRLVHEHKKKTPLINELDRAYMVDNLKSVTGVMVFDQLIEMSDCIRGIATKENSLIRIFKHSDSIYGGKVFTYGGNTEHFVIPDIKRFQSTTEITNHLKES